MHAERIDAGRLHALEPAVVVGRLALGLDRQVDRRLHREGTLAEHGGAAVGGVRRARRHHHVLDAVEEDGGAGDSASCSGVLCATVRPAASDWPMEQNWQVLARL